MAPASDWVCRCGACRELSFVTRLGRWSASSAATPSQCGRSLARTPADKPSQTVSTHLPNHRTHPNAARQHVMPSVTIPTSLTKTRALPSLSERQSSAPPHNPGALRIFKLHMIDRDDHHCCLRVSIASRRLVSGLWLLHLTGCAAAVRAESCRRHETRPLERQLMASAPRAPPARLGHTMGTPPCACRTSARRWPPRRCGI